MKLSEGITEGSGHLNEDGWGFVGESGNVEAAWVFDGVTGINGVNVLPGGSDARWLVESAHGHLLLLAAQHLSLQEILASLVNHLIADWQAVSGGISLPADYDPPAACLTLVKRYAEGWKGLRLGDSCLMTRSSGRRMC